MEFKRCVVVVDSMEDDTDIGNDVQTTRIVRPIFNRINAEHLDVFMTVKLH